MTRAIGDGDSMLIKEKLREVACKENSMSQLRQTTRKNRMTKPAQACIREESRVGKRRKAGNTCFPKHNRGGGGGVFFTEGGDKATAGRVPSVERRRERPKQDLSVSWKTMQPGGEDYEMQCEGGENQGGTKK